MKRILYTTIIALGIFCSMQAWAQSPGKFKYQAVIRDANGAAMVNTNVDIRIQLFEDSQTGAAIYQETFQSQNTGDFGVVNLEIGTTGDLSALDWASTDYYAMIQMKPAGSGSYIDISNERSQLVSVPYAMHANSSDTASYALGSPVSEPVLTLNGQTLGIQGASTTVQLPQTVYTAGTGIDINGSNVVSNTAPNVDQNLTISGNTLSLSGSTPASVTLNFTVNGSEVSLNGTPVFTIPTQTPAGTIVAYGGTNAPAGWVLCDGTSYSTSGAYANLYAAIQYAFGGSNGNFNVPDFRGRFLRGVDAGADRDPDRGSRLAMNTGGNPGNLVGSVQGDEFKSHEHLLRRCGSDCFYPDLQTGYNTTNGNEIGGNSGAVHGGTAKEGGQETRPINAYVNYIIKL